MSDDLVGIDLMSDELIVFLRARLDEDYEWARERDHILRHNPARDLAEVEAKRRMLQDADDYCSEYDVEIDDDNSAAQRAYHWRLTIWRNLAAAYSDHPDYRAQWAPFD